MQDSSVFQIILIVVITVISVVATIGYYFARYYFQPKGYDPEKIQQQKPGEHSLTDEILTSKSVKDQSFTMRQSQPHPEFIDQPPAEIVLEETVIVEAPMEEPFPLEPPTKTLQQALGNTRASFWGRIKSALTGGQIEPEDLEYLEEILYTSDIGTQTVQRLLSAVEDNLEGRERRDLEKVREALRMEMLHIFADQPVNSVEDAVVELAQGKSQPQVWMVVGVNGAGKTTTIGKMAHRVAEAGLKVLVVAGDTFRAAAGDQLKVWSDRARVEIFSPIGVSDPSAVAFDGCQMGQAKGFDLVIVDTAGRLHTQSNLMDELRKMKRVIQKVLPEAPHEILIILDANSGQNALVQAKTFNEALGLTGAVITKMDGTAKGGVALGLAGEVKVPIRLVGIGEGIQDIKGFQSKEFVDSIL